jgi:hypothetical protein
MGGRAAGSGRAAWRVLSVLVTVVTCSACGSGPDPSALAPSSTSGLRTIELVSGDDRAPVAGALVRLGARSATTDSRGRIVVDFWDAGTLDVQAAGFLPRETSLGPDVRFSLWPVGPEYPDTYVRHLLYTAAARPSGAEQPLRRVVAPVISVVPSDALARDPEAAAAHRHAAALATAATGGAVRFQVDPAPRGEVVFLSSVEAGGGAEGALTYRNLRGDTIVGGRITFSQLRYARDARFVTHELGHALGLQHSPDPRDMMHFSCGSGCAEAFSDRERLTIRLLLQRPPGNSYPDRDRRLAAASAPGISVAVD